jgi:hypothetical protein
VLPLDLFRQVDRGEQGLWEGFDVVVAVSSRRRKVVPRIVVAVRSRHRKVVPRIDGSNDSSTSQIGRESREPHLGGDNLDAFAVKSEGDWLYSTILRDSSGTLSRRS